MNAPNINFKDILQKLSVFKDNVSLLISIIVTLIAILLFIPTKLMSNKLIKQVEKESIAMARKIDQAKRKPLSRALPDEMRQYLEVYSNDANQISQLALESTQRELLSYNIFPSQPNDAPTLLFQEFAQNYMSGIDKMFQRLGAGECPSVPELEKGLESLSTGPRRSFNTTTKRTPRLVRPTDLGLKSMTLGDAEFTIVDGICMDKAKECRLYGNPFDVAGYTFWNDYKYDLKVKDAIRECWYYQLGYWITEDVMQTIETVNAGYDNVLEAPVKRFMKLTFTMGLKKASQMRQVRHSTGFARKKRKEQENDRPNYVIEPADGLSESCTGRLSDDDIDVVHFNFTVIVNAKSVLPFMKALCSAKEHRFKGFDNELPEAKVFKHNQITVLESSVASFSLEDKNHARYRYGDNAVVELDLICEYIFNKKAYDAKKPEIVKNPPEEK